MQKINNDKVSKGSQCLIIVCSYHHNNTARIAKKFSEVLNAQVLTPENVVIENLQNYELIGFGSGIDSGKHYEPLLDLADRLLEANEKPCFIFSTIGVQGKTKVEKDHSLLRQKLQSKGYTVVDEFSCIGLNTNSFLKYFGGMNKGKPDQSDLKHAEEFALSLMEKGRGKRSL